MWLRFFSGYFYFPLSQTNYHNLRQNHFYKLFKALKLCCCSVASQRNNDVKRTTDALTKNPSLSALGKELEQLAVGLDNFQWSLVHSRH